MRFHSRRMVLGLALLFAAGGVLTLPADDPAKSVPAEGAVPREPLTPAEHDAWMRLKLVCSEEAFRGLTNGDLERVERAARRMLVFNLLEQWLKRRDFDQPSEYQGQLNAYEYSVKELVRHAKAREMDGALEAYVQMSRSCVRCHQLLRD